MVIVLMTMVVMMMKTKSDYDITTSLGSLSSPGLVLGVWLRPGPRFCDDDWRGGLHEHVCENDWPKQHQHKRSTQPFSRGRFCIRIGFRLINVHRSDEPLGKSVSVSLTQSSVSIYLEPR